MAVSILGFLRRGLPVSASACCREAVSSGVLPLVYCVNQADWAWSCHASPERLRAACELALCSYLLFLFPDQLDDAFQRVAVQELLRVDGEVRIFPLIDTGQHSLNLPGNAAVRPGGRRYPHASNRSPTRCIEAATAYCGSGRPQPPVASLASCLEPDPVRVQEVAEAQAGTSGCQPPPSAL